MRVLLLPNEGTVVQVKFCAFTVLLFNNKYTRHVTLSNAFNMFFNKQFELISKTDIHTTASPIIYKPEVIIPRYVSSSMLI